MGGLGGQIPSPNLIPISIVYPRDDLNVPRSVISAKVKLALR